MGSYWSARAAVTKYRKPGGLNNRNYFSHHSGGWKAENRVSAGLTSSEAVRENVFRPLS